MRSTEGMSPERIAKREKEAADVKAIGAIADRALELRRSEFVGIEQLDGFEAQQIHDAAFLLKIPAEHVVVANIHNTEEAARVRDGLVSDDGDLKFRAGLAFSVHPQFAGVVVDDEHNGLWCSRDTAERIMNGDYSRSSVIVMLLAVRAGNPKLSIDWARFLAFDDFNFNHDFYGMVRCAEVPSGKLGRGFLPRCARGG